jgi:uncharacterized protein
MNRIVHFEMEADKPERAAEFYKKVFGWKFTEWDGSPEKYWMIDTGKGDGIGGGLSKKRGKQHVVNTIDVASVSRYVKKIKENGGEIIMEKTSIPGVGYMANFKDTEKNIFGIIEYNKKAK